MTAIGITLAVLIVVACIATVAWNRARGDGD